MTIDRRMDKEVVHIHDGIFSSVQFNSVSQPCPTLCDSMNCSMPGLPVHHQLPEFTQAHVHRVGDAIQPSHPLSSSLRMDWLDLLEVQGTFKSLLQYHSSKALILWCPAFFMVQLSHSHMTTGKTVVLTIETFVGK